MPSSRSSRSNAQTLCHFKILLFEYLEINVFKQDNRRRRVVVVNRKGELYEITERILADLADLVGARFGNRTSLSEIVGDFPTPLIQNVSVKFYKI